MGLFRIYTGGHVTGALPIGTFDAARPLCPRCGRVLLGRVYARPDCTLMTCAQRPSGNRCSAHVVLIAAEHGKVHVIGLPRDAFDDLMIDARPAGEVLEAHGYEMGRAA